MRGRFGRSFGRQTLGVATALAVATSVCFAQVSPQAATIGAPAAARVAQSATFGTRGPSGAGSLLSILGSAWKSDNTPIPFAKLRLRNLLTGKIEASTTADVAGQFVFDKIAGGSYLVELVSDTGKVLALSHPFTVGSGETVATFVRLGTKVPWFDGFFASAALAVAAGAAAAGLTAVAPEQVRPVSGRQ